MASSATNGRGLWSTQSIPWFSSAALAASTTRHGISNLQYLHETSPSAMSCYICTAAHSRLSFHCTTCARNRLYPLRLDYCQVLLENDTLSREIETAVSAVYDDSGGSSRATKLGLEDASHGCSPHWVLQNISNQRAASLHRREVIRERTLALKEKVHAKKTDITKRKETLARRRSDAASAQYQLDEREAAILTGIQNTARRTEHLWHSLHSRTAEARIFLCREAANIHGLGQRVSKKHDSRPTYILGGIPVVDLRDMNGATPGQISTSLSNIARLVVLISHYLSLRLPAEITLPHRDYPTVTIYTPAASYSSHDARNGPLKNSSSSPTASRTADTRSKPRPRPLFIEKALPQLAKEDPGTYGLFLEGATLLAWDVAWLCRTQGINLSSDAWEDICNIGKSLWDLLIAPPAQASTLMRAFAGRDTQTKLKPSKNSPQTTIQRMRSFPMLGHYSHGTSHSFLSASEGSEFMRTWKLPTPTKVADKLKANLLSEMTGAEWELLEEQEWEDENAEIHSVVNSQHPFSTSKLLGPPPEPSEVSTTPTAAVSPGGSDASRRQKGTSGWTKLNSR